MGRLLKAQAVLGGVILLVAIAAVAGPPGAGACVSSTSGPVGGVPTQLIPLYKAAAAKYALGPQGPSVLAAINEVESNFGQDLSTSSAGAMGWMQFEPGTWAQYGVTPSGAKAPFGPQGWNDPRDAIFSAANLLHVSTAPGNWQAAIFTYNHAQWYVEKVLSLAQSYYAKGLRRGAGSTSATSASTCAVTAPGGYVNPFAHTTNLVPQRIDMGVDYDGTGPIDALGNGRITFAGTGIGGNWICSTNENGGVVYQLQNGQYRGRYVYVTEDVIPTVKAGDTVSAGEQIASFAPPGGHGCIETGWSSGPSPNPEAAVLGQQGTNGDAGDNRTYCGQQFSDVLHSLGAPGGLENQPPSGSSCG